MQQVKQVHICFKLERQQRNFGQHPLQSLVQLLSIDVL